MIGEGGVWIDVPDCPCGGAPNECGSALQSLVWICCNRCERSAMCRDTIEQAAEAWRANVASGTTYPARTDLTLRVRSRRLKGPSKLSRHLT